jgi:2-polyprenyl-3-methyl-5-hydroxy-6-metoxy-1,4-benzoquinol methylase
VADLNPEPLLMMNPTAPTPEALDAIAALCTQDWDHYYTRVKLRSDPVYAAVAEALAGSSLPILDIGCGIGLLGHYLRACGHRAPVTGFDYDARKIASARLMAVAGGHADMDFSCGDARTEMPAFSGHVVILDILQFFTARELQELLSAAAARVAPGGKLMIRTTLRDDSWRFRITVLGDYLARLTRWMKANPTSYPDLAQIRCPLEEAGLQVSVQPLWGRTPFNNYLIIGRR